MLKQLHCCPGLNVRVHSSNVKLAAVGVHPVGMSVTFQRLFGRKSRNFYTPPVFSAPAGYDPSEFREDI